MGWRQRIQRTSYVMGIALLGALFLSGVTTPTRAAPYAAVVMDARNGEIYHSRSADRKLHPASLTKMMTIYLTIEAVKAGRISLDQKVTISRKAASQPPSRIGLRRGQKVSIRNLMRATAVKSANDAAMALAEAVGGSQENFARMMTSKARMLGMTNTTFKNPHGLTQKGHLSTARDMATLGRRLFFDYPEYYNMFGRKSTYTMGRTVRNTNFRLLSSYRGADGIKTGYTRAAGYNLVASAKRGKERIIVALFGGKSSADRTRRVAQLLDMGFRRAPTNVRTIKPGANFHLVARSSIPEAKPRAGETVLARVSSYVGPSAAQASEAIRAGKHAPRSSVLPNGRPGSNSIYAIRETRELPARKPGAYVLVALPELRP